MLPETKRDNDLTVKELLTIKTGELLAKTDELREVNESLHLLNNEIRKKSEEVRNSKKDLTDMFFVEHILTIDSMYSCLRCPFMRAAKNI